MLQPLPASAFLADVAAACAGVDDNELYLDELLQLLLTSPGSTSGGGGSPIYARPMCSAAGHGTNTIRCSYDPAVSVAAVAVFMVQLPH